MAGLNTDFLTADQLHSLGFASLGENVLIHSTAVLVNCAAMEIGSNVRVDPFTVLSAGKSLRIGSNVHVAGHCTIVGSEVIEIDDFCGVSHGSRILSATDDFSGASLSGPTVPSEFRRVYAAPMRLGRHVLLGMGVVVLPGASIGDGASVGALSLVTKPLEGWMIYAGSPARPIKPRRRDLLELEQRYVALSSDSIVT